MTGSVFDESDSSGFNLGQWYEYVQATYNLERLATPERSSKAPDISSVAVDEGCWTRVNAFACDLLNSTEE